MTHLIPRREDIFFPLQREFDKLFDELFSSHRFPSVLNSIKSSRSAYPKLDILVTDGKFRIEVAVPGVSPGDLSVEVITRDDSERDLRISGRMSHDYQYSNSTDYEYRELSRSKFQRVVRLPGEVKGEPDAVIKNGMLTLTWDLPGNKHPASVKVINVNTDA